MSPPQWTLGGIAVITIVTQVAALYDPSGVQKEFSIPSAEVSRLIALLLIIINGFDLAAAIQDNWGVYWYSAGCRVVAATFFWTFGPQWRAVFGLEIGTLGMLLASMWFA